MPKKCIVGIAVLLVVLVAAAATCGWIYTHTPVKDSPEEYAYHRKLIENKELLGKTKQEVYDLVGFPDAWYQFRLGAFPNGMDIEDERIHVWMYETGNDATNVSFDLYFSDEGTVDFCDIYWEDIETSEIKNEEQGTPNQYLTFENLSLYS